MPFFELKIDEAQRQLILRALRGFRDDEALGQDYNDAAELVEFFEELCSAAPGAATSILNDLTA